MVSQSMVLLINLTIATSIAVLLVAFSTRVLRRAAGAQAAYWLWLMIPGSALAVIVPAPSDTLGPRSWEMPHSVTHVLASSITGSAATDGVLTYALIGVLVWAVGAAVMVIQTVRRQQTFVRSLRPLWWLPNDTYRSHAILEPMLVGAWDARIVLPADFEARYTQEECALVLAHERAHVQRGDALANAIATSWLCVLWFNPLAYWAVRRFRLDQELACDARVLTTAGAVRRSYANALLKVQLSVDPIEPAPIGCHWHAAHPLKERIAMLKHPLPGAARRIVGVAMAILVIVSGAYAMWATQPIPHVVATHKSC